jgi:hypothetical protein
MSSSTEATADAHADFDALASETDVEANPAFVGEKRHKEDEDDALQKRLTLTFKNVTVNVTAPGEALGDTLLSYANPTQLLSLFRRKEHTKRVWACHGHGCA